jgi:hypothetical protein
MPQYPMDRNEKKGCPSGIEPWSSGIRTVILKNATTAPNSFLDICILHVVCSCCGAGRSVTSSCGPAIRDLSRSVRLCVRAIGDELLPSAVTENCTSSSWSGSSACYNYVCCTGVHFNAEPSQSCIVAKRPETSRAV